MSQVATDRRARFSEGEFADVLAAAQAGSGAALERLYREFAGSVTGYFRVQGGREPEDLTSETFLSAFRSLPRFKGDEAGFRSWLFTIAHRRLLDERRRASRRPAADTAGDPFELADEIDVEAVALGAIGTEQVRNLCARLVPDQRDVLLLRLIGGLTVDQVASALGKSPGAVKALQRRGLAAMQRLVVSKAVTL